MALNEYDQIIKEHFDLFDAPTRKCIVSLEDGEQSQLLGSLSNALYNKIISNVDKIDFGSIPASRGDITKVDKFEDTEECLIIMSKLVNEYKQDPTIINNVLSAIDNIKKRKAVFAKAFALDIQSIMMLYNLTVSSIEQIVSFLISVCIEYIKTPETDSMQMALDKVAYHNAQGYVLYQQVVAFNEACNNGNIDKIIDAALKNKADLIGEGCCKEEDDIAIVAKVDQMDNGDVVVDPKDVPVDPETEPVHEEEPEEDYSDEIDGMNGEDADEDIEDYNDDLNTPSSDGTVDAQSPIEDGCCGKKITEEFTVGSALIIAGGLLAVYKLILKVLIPMLRNMVYFLIHSTLKFSTCLDVQANLIEMNAYEVELSSIEVDGFDSKKRASIVQKQRKIADKLKKASNKIAMIFSKADKKAKEDVKADFSKLKVEDIKNDIPTEMYNKSVLF